MIQVPVYNTEGELLRHLEVDECRLGGTVNRALLRQAVLAYEANRRAGNAKTRTRAEVSYSGRKLYRQKHTGRARAGDRGSPVRVGGGVAHGPRPRDYSQKLNKKMRRRALASALLTKLQASRVKLLEQLQLDEPKTRQMARIMAKLGLQRAPLFVLPEHDALLWRCTRNIPGASMRTGRELNAYEVLRARELVFTEEAFEQTLALAAEQSRAEQAPEAHDAAGE